ncbi:MAG: macro domain-containing protein [Anaerolineales bacterium]|nr:macro domain-containing protein [Anaerolineales bacterium]
MNEILIDYQYPSGQVFQIVQGDLTEEKVDAIVNAANAHLQHGGGVAGIISRRGGPAIQRESNEWVAVHGPVPHASPAWTSAGELPARYVIHAVGPMWGEGDEDAKLAAAVDGTLWLAEELDLVSISLPAISTGIFGFPKERAAGVIFLAIEDHFVANPSSGVRQVRLVLYDRPAVETFLEAWKERL